jgi:hypothetical protein
MHQPLVSRIALLAEQPLLRQQLQSPQYHTLVIAWKTPFRVSNTSMATQQPQQDHDYVFSQWHDQENRKAGGELMNTA